MFLLTLIAGAPTIKLFTSNCFFVIVLLAPTTVSIRRTTGFEPFYTVIATVTINLIVAVAIVLLNLYVAAEISYLIL